MRIIGPDNLSSMRVFSNADFAGKTALILSTWFFSGYLPVAPGTFGTLCAVPLVLALGALPTPLRAISLSALFIIAVWSSGKGQKLLEKGDPSEVVIDEVVGFSATMFLLTPNWYSLTIGFLLFRFFDILKPFPIKDLERLKGGLGIVSDDVMAGVYAFAGTKIVTLLIQ